jgi:hypothetical protein
MTFTLLSGTTVNAILFVAYGVGNAAGPFMWKQMYQPRYVVTRPSVLFAPHSPLFCSRNRVPWIINTIVFGVCAIVLLILRTYLSWENQRREAEEHDDTYEDVYFAHVDEKGDTVEKKVDKVSNTCISLLFL